MSTITMRRLIEVFTIALLCAVGMDVRAADPPRRLARVGYLAVYPPIPVGPGLVAQHLAKLGYVEGKNLQLEVRHAGGHAERLPELAAELVKLKIDVIYAVNDPAVFAARDATSTIPIVGFAMHGAVETGLVSNLRRPGGNITGTDSMAVDLDAKRLELLKQLVPGLTRLTVLYDVNDQGSPHHMKNIQAAAKDIGLAVATLTIQQAEDLAPLFAANAGKPLGSVYPLTSTTIFRLWPQIGDFAFANRLPTLCEFRQMAQSGCLLSYGPSLDDIGELCAVLIDKILRGTPPGELPIERPTRFELVINLKTANALGVTVPQSLLLRAEEVIR
jgi:putative ABC transport system substrate-binding protein